MTRYKNKISSITATCLGKSKNSSNITTNNTTNYDHNKNSNYPNTIVTQIIPYKSKIPSQSQNQNFRPKQSSVNSDYLCSGDSSEAYAFYHQQQQNLKNQAITVSSMGTSSNFNRNKDIYENEVIQNTSRPSNSNRQTNLTKKAADQFSKINPKTKNIADTKNWAKVLPPFRVINPEPESEVELEQEQQQDHIHHVTHEPGPESYQIRDRTSKFSNFSDKIKNGSVFMKQIHREHEREARPEHFAGSYDERVRFTKNSQKNENFWSKLHKIFSNFQIHWPSVVVTILAILLAVLSVVYMFIRRQKIEGSCLEIWRLGERTECTCSSTCGLKK